MNTVLVGGLYVPPVGSELPWSDGALFKSDPPPESLDIGE